MSARQQAVAAPVRHGGPSHTERGGHFVSGQESIIRTSPFG